MSKRPRRDDEAEGEEERAPKVPRTLEEEEALLNRADVQDAMVLLPPPPPPAAMDDVLFDDVLMLVLGRVDDLATARNVAQVNKHLNQLLARLQRDTVALFDGMAPTWGTTVVDRWVFEYNLRDPLERRPLRVAGVFRRLVEEGVITGPRRWFHAYQMAMRIQWIGTVAGADPFHLFPEIESITIGHDQSDETQRFHREITQTTCIRYRSPVIFQPDDVLRPNQIEFDFNARGEMCTRYMPLVARNWMTTLAAPPRNPTNPRTNEGIEFDLSMTYVPDNMADVPPFVVSPYSRIRYDIQLQDNTVLLHHTHHRTGAMSYHSVVAGEPRPADANRPYDLQIRSTMPHSPRHIPIINITRRMTSPKFAIDDLLVRGCSTIEWADPRPGAAFGEIGGIFNQFHGAGISYLADAIRGITEFMRERPALTLAGPNALPSRDFVGMIAGLDFFRHSEVIDAIANHRALDRIKVDSIEPNIFNTRDERRAILKTFNLYDLLFYVITWGGLPARAITVLLKRIADTGLFRDLDQERSTLHPVIRWDAPLQCAHCAETATHVDVANGNEPLCAIHGQPPS